MKRFLSIGFVFLLSFSFAGCKDTDPDISLEAYTSSSIEEIAQVEDIKPTIPDKSQATNTGQNEQTGQDLDISTSEDGTSWDGTGPGVIIEDYVPEEEGNEYAEEMQMYIAQAGLIPTALNESGYYIGVPNSTPTITDNTSFYDMGDGNIIAVTKVKGDVEKSASAAHIAAFDSFSAAYTKTYPNAITNYVPLEDTAMTSFTGIDIYQTSGLINIKSGEDTTDILFCAYAFCIDNTCYEISGFQMTMPSGNEDVEADTEEDTNETEMTYSAYDIAEIMAVTIHKEEINA